MLTLPEVQDKLTEVMKAEPELTVFGIGVHHSFSKDETSHFREMLVSRSQLIQSAEDVLWAANFLVANVSKTKTINTNFSSYTLKHLLEKRYDKKYLANGVLIAAAVVAGYSYRRIKNSPNTNFSMSLKDVYRINKENIAFPRNR